MSVYNPDQANRHVQSMSMWGELAAREQIGEEKKPRKMGRNKKQLIGTVVGIIAVLAALFVLTRF